MPNSCIVNGSKSNYLKNIKEHGYVQTFSFPKNKHVCNKWLQIIPGNVSVKRNSVICIKHFIQDQIKFFNTKGAKRIPLKKPKLLPYAVPTIFGDIQNCTIIKIQEGRQEHQENLSDLINYNKIKNQ